MKRWGRTALAVMLCIGGATAALAFEPIERSGNTYHQAVCPHGQGLGIARCFARVVTDARGNPREEANVVPHATPSGYGPLDIQSAYKLTTPGSSTITVAIVDAYGYTNAESDLATYRSTFGLPACSSATGCFTKLNQNGVAGNYPRMNTGWAQETALDLDMVSATCPNCKILLVEANSASLADLGTAVNMAAARGAHVISNSYGGGESGSTSYEGAYNHPGIAITVSSGDSGFGVQFPASSPHVTAVGGTSLVKDSSVRRWSETVWSGAGSGCSTVYAKPTWQSDGGCAMRMEADVSAIADPNTGVAVYGPATRSTSSWQVYGGTSVAAPIVGGIYGLNGGAVNYGSDPYSHTSALFDVISGSNGTCGGSYLCTAGPGYDGPTGLGTPNGPSAF